MAFQDGGRVRAWIETPNGDSCANETLDTINVSLVRRAIGPTADLWTAISVPAENTQATATRAAAGANIRNVCTGLTVMLVATATAPTAVNVTMNLIDGGTGGTTFLWRATLSLPATAGASSGITRSGLWLPGTANTAMTLEASASGGANTIESVSLEGVVL